MYQKSSHLRVCFDGGGDVRRRWGQDAVETTPPRQGPTAAQDHNLGVVFSAASPPQAPSKHTLRAD